MTLACESHHVQPPHELATAEKKTPKSEKQTLHPPQELVNAAVSVANPTHALTTRTHEQKRTTMLHPPQELVKAVVSVANPTTPTRSPLSSRVMMV